jgi:hypothetical protein
MIATLRCDVQRPGKREANAAASALLIVLLVGCGPPRASETQTPQDALRQPQFVGKVWLATDPSAAPGTLRIFLPNGTLLMDSCGETYRLAEWRTVCERRLEWTEDTARIAAEITRLTDDELELRLQLGGEAKDEAYRVAKAPMVCPDVPRVEP